VTSPYGYLLKRRRGWKEEVGFRLISPEPRLAARLRERKPLIVPETIYDWAVGWVEDVGTIMRSRATIASVIASGIYYVILFELIGRLVPVELPRRRPLIGRFLEGIGVPIKW